jgi:hypothetical protein
MRAVGFERSPRHGTLRTAGRVVQVSWQGGQTSTGGARGRIRRWSPASRRRLLFVAGSVDWEGLRSEWGGEWLFVTLTYRTDPGPDRCKRDLDVLARGWARRWGACRWLWKMEFQRRGVVHFHVLAWVPKSGQVPLTAYRIWLWEAWRRIAGEGDRLRVDVDYSRARDMVRYFVAYADNGRKAYQRCSGRLAGVKRSLVGTSRPPGPMGGTSAVSHGLHQSAKNVVALSAGRRSEIAATSAIPEWLLGLGSGKREASILRSFAFSAREADS